MQKDANYYIEILLSYYGLSSLQELAHKLDVKQPSISSWKARNSVSAIKKKCRELGIYNEIFGDNSTQITNLQNSTNQVGQNFGDKNKIITSGQSDEFDKMDKTIVQSFIDVYFKLDKKNELKKLYDLLGDLKYSK